MRKIACPNKSCRRKIIPAAIQNDPEHFFCPFCFSKLDGGFALVSVYTGPRGLDDVLSDIDQESRARPASELDYRP